MIYVVTGREVSRALNFQAATFTGAYGPGQKLPRPTAPEVAFAGRSNVGKSSLLNRLASRKNLAHTSATPGKTQTINFYDAAGALLVDLPGYGYAKVSQAARRQWSKLMSSYFESDRPIALVVTLVDGRHPPTALDLQLADYLDALGLARAVVATKADKLSRAETQRSRARIAADLGIAPEEVLITSSLRATGIDEVARRIANAVNSKAEQAL